MDVSKGREVLPTNVKPVHYDLTLEPDFEKFSYEGRVVIEYVWPKDVETTLGTRRPVKRVSMKPLADSLLCVAWTSKKIPPPYP